jgi:hypothetical protein
LTNSDILCQVIFTPLPSKKWYRGWISTKNTKVWHEVIQAIVVAVLSCHSKYHHKEMRFKASCLAMRGAYKWNEFLPFVRDPLSIIIFPKHHLDIGPNKRPNQHKPIQNTIIR